MGLYNFVVIPKIVIIFLTFLFVLLDKGKKNIEVDKRTVIIGAISATALFLSVSFFTLMIDNVIIYSMLYSSQVYIYK